MAALCGPHALRWLFVLGKAWQIVEDTPQGNLLDFHCDPVMILTLSHHLTIQVVLLLFILATQLRDQLPRLRVALFTVIWALRRMDGQVHSFEAATKLGILPGSRTIDPSVISAIHRDLVIGLCLLEGCLPVSHLHPALHHLVHFAQYTMTHGCLRSLWMMYFER